MHLLKVSYLGPPLKTYDKDAVGTGRRGEPALMHIAGNKYQIDRHVIALVGIRNQVVWVRLPEYDWLAICGDRFERDRALRKNTSPETCRAWRVALEKIAAGGIQTEPLGYLSVKETPH